MDELVTIFSSNSPAECYIIKGRLENEGIECFIFDENIVSVNPFYANAVGGVKVKIYWDQKEKAEEILHQKPIDLEAKNCESASNAGTVGQGKEYCKQAPNKHSDIHCPQCGSGNVYYGIATDYKWNIPSLVLSLLLCVPFPLFRKKYHCFDCNTNFKKKKTQNNLTTHITSTLNKEQKRSEYE